MIVLGLVFACALGFAIGVLFEDFRNRGKRPRQRGSIHWNVGPVSNKED